MATAEAIVTMAVEPETAWASVGRFDDPSWIHGVSAHEVEGEGVGARRTLHLEDGARPVEVLAAVGEHAYTFEMPDDVPLPVRAFRSELSVVAIEGGCEVRWVSTFEADGVHPAAVVRQLSSMYASSLYAVKRALEGSADA